jgi:hypothetical protein
MSIDSKYSFEFECKSMHVLSRIARRFDLIRSFLDFPEAVNMTIASLRVYSDPPCRREVHLAFTDGTQISIDLEIHSTVKAKHYRGDKGELEVFHEYEDRSTT